MGVVGPEDYRPCILSAVPCDVSARITAQVEWLEGPQISIRPGLSWEVFVFEQLHTHAPQSNNTYHRDFDQLP